ncbi:hypothetical protein EDD29_9021 [Actinocorallia herbida]|uniref:Interferon-induced transmembrane protein n=1 Tax=Actinocorallia herbida TaxID=58109 RepID=A0A3N1DDL2_9ACTN|nr:hypothetical protein [Actinocorallia herbida]ROO91268.1 hypothetical protein EDD29_9021 [Actinocorallia herbida]
MSYGYPNPDPGSYGYGIPGHPNQYGGYGPPPPPPSNGAAIGALVANIILTITCCGLFAIPGIVTAAIAMGRYQTDPVSARKLTTASWIIFGVAIVLGILLVIVYVFFLASFSEGGGSDWVDNGGQRI